MTPMRWLYAAFWIFIGTMLIWQFNTYNGHINQAQAVTPPQQKHFYFLPGAHSTDTLGPAPKPDGADIQQISFTYDKDTTPGSFICHVVLKNEGNMKGVGIQVLVTPFRGIVLGDPDGGRGPVRTLSDSDPIAQTSQWVTFPDLAPGELNSQDVVFSNYSGYKPGTNSHPQILFHTEKPKPAAPGPVFPPTP